MAGTLGWIIFGIFVLQHAFVGMAWTGEIHGRVFCDVCGDGSMGPEDDFLEGAEVAVLCMTISGEVLNYQAFTNSKGIFTVAETMSESSRWDMCLARPISSIHQDCNVPGINNSATKFSYTLSSGHSYTGVTSKRNGDLAVFGRRQTMVDYQKEFVNIPVLLEAYLLSMSYLFSYFSPTNFQNIGAHYLHQGYSVHCYRSWVLRSLLSFVHGCG